jgi:cell division septum initiation protein DivIVA
MADDTENTATDVTDQPATGELGDAGKKALDAERREKRAAEKRAAELEARLKEFEDRDKSESTRAIERAEAAEKAAAAAEARALRLEIAAEKGLTPAQAKRLVGETREELEADADELLETFKPATSDEADTAQESVTESLDLGIRSGAPKKGKSTADLFAAAIDGSFTR